MAGKSFWGSPKLVIGLSIGLAVAGLGSVVVVAIDRHATARLPSGTVIGDVPVGGLDFEAAVVRVRRAVEDPLRQPVVLKTERFEITTTPWDLGYRVDVASTVRSAMRADGNVLTRLGSKVLSPTEPVFVDAPAEWGEGDLDAVLAKAAEQVKEAPQNADIDISTGFLKFTPEKAGRILDVDASKKAVMDGVRMGDGSVRLVTTPIAPGAGDEALNKVILVRTGENKLYLYDKGVMVKSWSVATGSASYPTPTGIYKIITKIENPSWYNPGSDWAKGLPKVIGPGPVQPPRHQGPRARRARHPHPRHVRPGIDRLQRVPRVHPHARGDRGRAVLDGARRHPGGHRLGRAGQGPHGDDARRHPRSDGGGRLLGGRRNGDGSECPVSGGRRSPESGHAGIDALPPGTGNCPLSRMAYLPTTASGAAATVCAIVEDPVPSLVPFRVAGRTDTEHPGVHR